ncbi:MAG: NAD(P)H-binding protein [Flavobacteriales bacterium]
MNKRILITGASGMIGQGILNLALESNEVSEIISLVRKPSKQVHSKLIEIVVKNFSDLSEHQSVFEQIDAAYFCIGVYTGQVKDDLFKTITVDYPTVFAQLLKQKSPEANFCLLSGAGADKTEKSKTAFAKYKGMAENNLNDTGLNVFSFRPGYIYPVVPRKEPNLMYKIIRIFYPILKAFGNKYSIKSSDLEKAMFLIGLNGFTQETLENIDIVNYIETK